MFSTHVQDIWQEYNAQTVLWPQQFKALAFVFQRIRVGKPFYKQIIDKDRKGNNKIVDMWLHVLYVIVSIVSVGYSQILNV